MTPEVTDYIDQYIAETQQKVDAMARAHAEGPHAASIIFDIDEMFVDTVARHVTVINRLARRKGVTADQLPTYDKIVAAGGTNSLYPELFGMTPDEWETVMERIRALSAINTNAPVYAKELDVHMGEITQRTDPLGYITAKPYGVQNPRGAYYDTGTYTETDLHDRLHLPRLPLILRPITIAATAASGWKLELIEQIQAAKPEKPVILLDDSIPTAGKMKALNEQRMAQGKLPIFQIVMADGSLTKPKIESGTFQPAPEHGIYLSGWQQVGETIDVLSQRWVPQHQQ